MARVDRWRKIRDSWQHASSTFRRAIDESGWAKKATAVRESLGKNVNRRTKSSEPASTLPGAPDGEYYVMKFDSSFERKKSAFETVIAMKDTDGSWRVAGYFIR